ncbi:DEAD/DEAH box helicase [candidate division CSSED10-310 bacterium]|uniref:DEAD/DEAH box helicase n=1 Tax=candidate division CSSED10-310 bacterium TaxID=2855610 RepID=A0ABV6YVK7_UNCC1
MKFTELNLKPEILKALNQMGYTELTPIQEQTFPGILSGKDLIATAETGSGKTSACGIPLIQRIDSNTTTIQILILVPTRELALQYLEEISRLGQYLKIVPFAVYGGFDLDIQKMKLNHLVHILIATPGRLIDLLYRGDISLAHVKTVVLDEADEMMKQGFLEDIDFLLSCLVHEHATLLFSATMPPEIKKLAQTYLRQPVIIELNKEDVAPQSLEHQFQYLAHANRRDALLNMLKQESVKQAIIFCNSRFNAERLFQTIKKKLPQAEMIHGGLEQSKRNTIMRRFRAGQIRYMIATDLAGRGLDFQNVSHVLNYDFPHNPVNYTHRTGRTGRMGRAGTALTLVTKRDVYSTKRLIRSNRISPVWISKEPDLSRKPPKSRIPAKKRPPKRANIQRKHPIR